MANVLWGIPPDNDTAFDMSKGTYLRMGTYSDDPDINVDERLVLPFEYLQDQKTEDKEQALQASEGIMFSTRGSYVVETEKQGVIDIGAGISEHVTGAGNDLEEKTNEGNIYATIEKGNLSINGTSSFDIESTSSDVTFNAANGVLKTKANKLRKFTKGSHIERVLADSVTDVRGTNTCITSGPNVNLLIAGSASFNISAVEVYPVLVVDISLAPITVGLVNLSRRRLSETYLTVDTQYSVFLVNSSAVQLSNEFCHNDLNGVGIFRWPFGLKEFQFELLYGNLKSYSGLFTAVAVGK